MSAIDDNLLIPRELLAELQEAACYAAQGVRDPEVMKNASQRMERMQEEIYCKTGLLEVGVSTIRKLREEE